MAPSRGPYGGGNVVTLSGARLGVNDVTAVTFNGTAALAVTWSSSTRVLAVAPAASAFGVATITLVSESFGSGAASYTYNSPSVIVNVVPNIGPNGGGGLVTLSGSNLGESQSDVSAVSLCGTSVAAYTWVSSSSIVAVAGSHRDAAGCSGGNAIVVSSNYGTANLSAAYTYRPRAFRFVYVVHVLTCVCRSRYYYGCSNFCSGHWWRYCYHYW